MKPSLAIEHCVDQSPQWLKKFYVACIFFLKVCLKRIGIIRWLDKQAPQSDLHHYIRSLFAIHQLEDMIALDVPWWTYDSIAYLEQYVKNLDYPIHAFEYGSGASTLWLSKRCQSVISVEHDPKWYSELNAYVKNNGNLTLLLKPYQPTTLSEESNSYQSIKVPQVDFRKYVESIQSNYRLYDIIVIDGRCRNACLKAAIEKLNPQGIIIFDNSNRQRYQASLNQDNIQVKRFKGRVPGSPFASETAIIRLSASRRS